MGTIQFDIRHPNGQRESAVVAGQRALIGSGSHCDVRLPMDQAAHEHVVIEAVGGTLRAEAKADHPPVTVRNMPLTQCVLAADDILGIGQIRLYVAFTPDAMDGAGTSTARKKDGNPVIQIGLVAAFAGAMYFMLAEDEARIAPPPEQQIELFANATPKCPRANPVQAVALAEDQLSAARAKRERMPFDVSEGVSAVKLYELATTCFAHGGDKAGAEATQQERDSLKRDLVEDFRARRFRLSHMLKVEDYEIAQQDVKVLSALTEGQEGSYVEWLKQVSKQIEAKAPR